MIRLKNYTSLIGKEIDSVSIVDTENLIGRCVVAGNVRRSAALALGQHDDMQYLTMKNDQEKLYSHRWGSKQFLRSQGWYGLHMACWTITKER